VFNVVKLTAASKDLIPRQKTTVVSALVIVDDEEEWEVEEILNSKWY